MALQDMLDAQDELQLIITGRRPETITDPTERAEYVRTHMLALEDELHEAMAEVAWKPWATTEHFDRDAFKAELVDAWHFFMNLWLMAGGDAEQLEVMYATKRDKNEQRQRDGYDGKSTKCPICNRALDDQFVACVELTSEESENRTGFCRADVTGRPIPWKIDR